MNIKNTLKRGSFTLAAVMQLLFFPVSSATAFAQEVPPASETPPVSQTETSPPTPPDVEEDAAPPAATPPAPQPQPPVVAPVAPPAPRPKGPRPPGADSGTYIYNFGTEKWENSHFTYDPVTRVKTAKLVPTVRYNSQTNMWEKLGWQFNAPTVKYVPYVLYTSINRPTGITMGEIPSAPGTLGVSSGSSANPYTNGSSNSNANGTGPNSSNTINNTLNNNGTLNLNNSSDFNIAMNLLSQSGNALVSGNTTGGNATSGSAESMANVLNQVQSVWNIQDLLSFNFDLYGDLYGDLTVNTQNIGPQSNVAVNNTQNNNLDVNVANDTTINNDINVVANSGNATVRGNTTGGDAATGSATALANIINLVNSSIGSQGSFIGSLNIYGNLDGDILFPTGALNSIISDTGPNSNTAVNNTNNNTVNADINNDTRISNTVNSQAASGNASVANNTNGGNATSGTATSNVNIINLSGRDIVTENTLLVFINVLGQWVGVLMDAPTNTTAAAVGGNVTQNTVRNNNLDYTEDNTTNITNNVNVSASTGDALVAGNTTGGNATSGDANTAVNIANVTGTNISSSNWFGVLFINVFGSWNGSFGVDTAAGNDRGNDTFTGGRGGESPDGSNAPSVLSSTNSSPAEKVFSFVASGNQGSGSNKKSLRAVPITTSSSTQSPQSEGTQTSQDVLASASTGMDDTSSQTAVAKVSSNLPIFLGLVGLGALVLFGNRFLVFIAALKK